MSEGFKKGKIPERFEGKTDEELAVMQHIMWNFGKTVVEEIDGQITAHVSHYFDDELAAVQIIRRIERLEKALNKACDKLAFLDEQSLSNYRSNPLNHGYGYNLKSGSAEQWKEWCLKDD